MIEKIICIRCPEGCEITVNLDEKKNITEITGNSCKLGLIFAENEIKNPTRMLTTTVKVKNGLLPLVPVYTEKPVPKEKIFEIINELKKIEIEAPIKLNQIIVENIFNLGINILASRDIEIKGKNNG